MSKYHVHLYPVVGVMVCDVEAESQEQACKKAEEMVDLYQLFHNTPFNPPVGYVEYAGEIQSFVVDEDGDTSYSRSNWYDHNYRPS